MVAISLIHSSGGSKTITGETLKACRERAKAAYNRTSSSYIAATIPYVVYKHKRFGLDVYDATIPNEIKRGLGVEVRLILQESSE